MRSLRNRSESLCICRDESVYWGDDKLCDDIARRGVRLEVMAKPVIRWGLMALMVVTFAACDRADTAPDEKATDQSDDHEVVDQYYSPFLLTGEGEFRFEKISFTDVGLNQPDPGPVEPYLLETIAETLAYAISDHEALDFTPNVEYDPKLLEPANHRHCDKDHLYIALWRGYEPDRWGYSLWSGCDERQKFEWEEILDPYAEEVDTITWVEPLTESIVDSIQEAQDEDCFVARC